MDWLLLYTFAHVFLSIIAEGHVYNSIPWIQFKISMRPESWNVLAGVFAWSDNDLITVRSNPMCRSHGLWFYQKYDYAISSNLIEIQIVWGQCDQHKNVYMTSIRSACNTITERLCDHTVGSFLFRLKLPRRFLSVNVWMVNMCPSCRGGTLTSTSCSPVMSEQRNDITSRASSTPPSHSPPPPQSHGTASALLHQPRWICCH